jgi:hypothetical protein
MAIIRYERWYNSLMNKAKNRYLNGYVERHHIIPKSMGGSNIKENIVKLTAKEHYIAHLLLTKFTTGEYRKKMIRAFVCLRNFKNKNRKGDYRFNAKLYNKLRNEYAEIARENSTNRQFSLERRKNISKALTGKKLSPEHIEAIKKGKKNISQETRDKISKANKGRIVSLEKRKKLSEMSKRFWNNSPKAEQRRIQNANFLNEYHKQRRISCR